MSTTPEIIEGGDKMKHYKKMRTVVGRAKTKTYAYTQCACNC